MKQYVVGFVFRRGVECQQFVKHPAVVLLEKTKPEWQRGKLNGPGGKIEPGESPVQAVRREVWEETGLDIPEAKWEHFVTWHDGGNSMTGPSWEVYFFRTFVDDLVDLECRTDERPDWVFFTFGLRDVVAGLHWLLGLGYYGDAGLPFEVIQQYQPEIA